MPNELVEGVLSDSGAVSRANALRTDMAAAVLKLYQQSFAPSPESVVADFDAAEADYAGYAPVTITWSPVGVDIDGGAVFLSQAAFFQSTDAVTPNLIGGAWLELAGGDLIEYYPLATPVPLATALAYLSIQIQERVPGPSQGVVES